MKQYRVWRDYKRDSESEDGEEYTASNAEDAARLFGENQFRDLQHVDPGGVFVRELETDTVSYFCLSVRVSILAREWPRSAISEGEKP